MIAERLAEHALKTRRKWETDRSQTVGASEIGQCARRVFYTKNEDDPTIGSSRDPDHEDRWGATTRGSYFEEHFWNPAMEAAFGDKLLFAGANQRTFVDGYLSATSDGLILDLPPGAIDGMLGIDGRPITGFPGGDIVADCKTADPRTNLNEAKPENVYQIHVQIGLVRVRTNYRPEYGILSYTDASFWDETKEFVVKFDPEIYENAKERARLIMSAKSASELRPEGYIAGGKECDHCPFRMPCGVARAKAVPEKEKAVDEATTAAARELAIAIKLHSGRAEEAAEESKKYQFELRALLEKASTKKIAGDRFSVNWSAVKGRSALDKERLAQALAGHGLKLSDFETEGPPGDRLTVTVKPST